MSHKTKAARREHFFRVLARTGNQTLAAEQAKVSRSWVTLHRSTDPDFRRRIDEAVAAAQVHLSTPGGTQPDDKRLRWHDGEELAVRGTGGRGGGKRTQIARARIKQWSPAVEKRFLATLTATCNVKAACAEVGMTPASAYGHRKRWPAFHELWNQAIEIGYIQIEHAAVEAACQFLSPTEFPDVQPVREMTIDHAIHMLHMHKREVLGIGRSPGRHNRVRQKPYRDEREEARQSILRKIEAIEAHDKRYANDPDAQARREKREVERFWAERRHAGQGPGAGEG